MAIKIHLSIDDVIYSLMELKIKRPDSVFDNGFFRFLLEMNEKYNACFTLYAYENFAESFSINDVPLAYFNELARAGFIKIGFHGTFNKSENDTFLRQCAKFYSLIPQEIRTTTLRLHRFYATERIIEALKDYGITSMLCCDIESRKYADFHPSYILSEAEESMLSADGIIRNGMLFIRTDIRLEYFERRHLVKLLSHMMDNCCDDQVISIFTHEKRYKEYSGHIEDICRIVCSKYNTCFVF